MSAPAVTCTHCGAAFPPFALPPHRCPGTLAQVEADQLARTPLPLPSLDRRPMEPGDIVRFTERTAQGRHETREGVVTRLVDGGRSVLLRVGNTLHELSMARVTRVGRATQETAR